MHVFSYHVVRCETHSARPRLPALQLCLHLARSAPPLFARALRPRVLHTRRYLRAALPRAFLSAAAMGAPTELDNLKVAKWFTDIYYNVAASVPQELCLLYNDDSTLLHGDVSALGRDQIKLLSSQLPVVGQKAALFSVDVQQMASGGLVVVALGMLPNNKIFSQTFLLERNRDSNNHASFYCRNDVFRLLPDDPAAAVKAYVPDPLDLHKFRKVVPNPVTDPNKKPAPATSSPQTVVVDAPPNTPPDTQPDTVDSASAPTPPVASSTAPAAQSVTESETLADPIVEPQIPIATGNKDDIADVVESVAADEPVPTAVEVTATPAEAPVKEAPAPVPAAPKTWASIVSAQSASAPATAASVVDRSPALPAVAPTVTKPSAVAAPAATPADHSPVNKPVSAAGAPAPSALPHYAQRKTDAHRPKGALNAKTGKPYHEHGYNGYYKPGGGRVFGPSAVVQLSSVGSTWLGDTKALTQALREEFNNYGHRVRHVEVKQAKGIAFVEYDTLDGVAAAVTAWADGARPSSKFANTALAVSEKRHIRRPASTRGRGPPPRGRRAPRPPSSPAPS